MSKNNIIVSSNSKGPQYLGASLSMLLERRF